MRNRGLDLGESDSLLMAMHVLNLGYNKRFRVEKGHANCSDTKEVDNEETLGSIEGF